MAAGGSSIWKFLLLPPLFALLIYILTSYLLIPYYRRLRSHSSYTLLPSSLTPSSPLPSSFTNRIFSRISSVLGRDQRRGSGSGGSLLGDEELEEGFSNLTSEVNQDGSHDATVADTENDDRRLSRDLERGFRDSSDEEDDRRRVRR